MKTKAILLAAIFLAASCISKIHIEPFTARPWSGARPGIGETSQQEQNLQAEAKHLYISAVQYENSYNWQQDSLCGNAPCRVSFYRDMKKLLSFPAGPGTGVGTDPQAMVLSGGHIYTIGLAGDGTQVRRDGKMLFSYPEKETPGSMLIAGEDVYTLCIPSEGGCILRKNGEKIGIHPSHRPADLHEDKGEIYYCLYDVNGTPTLWSEGKQIPLKTSEGCLDLRMMDGVPWELDVKDRCASVSEDGRIIFRYYLDNGLSAISGRLVPGCCDCHTVLYAVKGGTKNVAYCCLPSMEMICSESEIVYFPMKWDETYSEIVECSGGTVRVTFEGETSLVSGKWRIMGEKCACFADGKLILALSSHSGSGAALWTGSKDPLQSLNINGYLTEVRYE